METDLLYTAMEQVVTAPKGMAKAVARDALQEYCTRREAPRPNGAQYAHHH
jgi:hypothetical protein